MNDQRSVDAIVEEMRQEVAAEKAAELSASNFEDQFNEANNKRLAHSMRVKELNTELLQVLCPEAAPEPPEAPATVENPAPAPPADESLSPPGTSVADEEPQA